MRKKNIKLTFSCVFVFLTFLLNAENIYKNGIHQGIVKVKFSSEMTTDLQKLKLDSKNGRLQTGIKNFDAVAQSVEATTMVRLFPENPNPTFEAKLRKHGLHLWYIVEISEDMDPVSVAERFEKLPEIKIAEAEYEKVLLPTKIRNLTKKEIKALRKQKSDPTMPFNDMLLHEQWHYNNTDVDGYDINLFKAWEMTAGRKDIIVAIHDQGVDVSHEDLKGNLWINETELYGEPGIDDDGNGYVDDIYGWNYDKGNGFIDPQSHGTHVAGTVAAVNNNNIGVAGVAGGTGNNDGVKVMPLQVLGGVAGATARSYIYAANMGAVISQNSWGFSVEGDKDDAVHDAIKYFIAEAGDYLGSPMKGGIVLFAAGNSNSDGEWYPNRYDEVLTVAALGTKGIRASYSNYGDWVNISAPGGDIESGFNEGILSTTPYDNYGWSDGTSMACPHVSGIAALIIANSKTQISNEMVWDRLVTGVVDVERKNPDYVGKLGSGASDAYLAIKPNSEIAPQQITDLAEKATGQDFIRIAWTVPEDEDDGQPLYMQIYYSTTVITENNLSSLNPIIIKNNKLAGEEATYEIEGLLSTTQYYIGVRSLDRWGNVSGLSNIIEATTNDGPEISIDSAYHVIQLSANANSNFIDSISLEIKNSGEGELRWTYEVRTKRYLATRPINAPENLTVNYPKQADFTAPLEVGIEKSIFSNLIQAEKLEAKIAPYETKTFIYAKSPTNIIGDSDKRLPNSAATRFVVNDPEGFNLTSLEFFINILREKGPAVFEIYSGANLEKAELLLAQEYTPPILDYVTPPADLSGVQHYAGVNLDEHLFFPDGSTFWVVVHAPAGNLYPFGIGYEVEEINSSHCFLSNDLGNTWTPLETALADKQFAWSINLYSQYAKIEQYLSLNPADGRVSGNSEGDVNAVVDATYLDNGYYEASIIFKSNDSKTPVYRIKAEIDVTGQVARLVYPKIVDFGNVFLGKDKSLQILIENVGYGNTTGYSFNFTSSNPDFKCADYISVASRNSAVININFKPSAISNINGILTFDVDGKTHSIMLVGAGLATPEIELTPSLQSKTAELGNLDTSYVTVKNTGDYPLVYFVPGFDDEGVSEDWPTSYNSVPYIISTSYDDIPVVYEYEDISATGIDITKHMRSVGQYGYYTLPMGFDFPYYQDIFDTIYIAQKGFTAFDNSMNPVNNPQLQGNSSVIGCISPLGLGFFEDISQIFVERRDDRVIIQYQDMGIGYDINWAVIYATVQMVLHKDGNIRFYYKKIADVYSQSYGDESSYYILIEDIQKENGIFIYGRDWSTDNPNYRPFVLKDSLAIGIDYPGPDIILSMKNASGILAPGASADVEVVLSTNTLNAGTYKKTLNFVCNTPVGFDLAQIILDVTGGAPKISAATTEVDFGTVYLESTGDDLIQNLVLRNDSTGFATIGMAFKDGTRFSVNETLPVIIDPRSSGTFNLEVDVTSVGELKDTVEITEGGELILRIPVKATVKASPVMSITDLTTINKTMAVGDIDKTTNLTIENTGASPLQFSLAGEDWLYMESTSNSSILDYDYTYKRHNDGSAYKWIDIVDSANRLPAFIDMANPKEFWRDIELDWPIVFYGQEYDSIKIGETGLISIGGNPPIMNFVTDVPTTKEGGFIFPMWVSLLAPDTYNYPERGGIYFKSFEDKHVVSYEYMMNAFGMGEPYSIQVIFFKNGIIKFQYKINGLLQSEGSSKSGTVAIESPDKSKYLLISSKEELEQGNGLCITLMPKNTYELNPTESYTGKLVLDATNILGGSLSSNLTITSNDPVLKVANKEVNLDLSGTEQIAMIDTLDFGTLEVDSVLSINIAIENMNSATQAFMINRFDPGTIPASYPHPTPTFVARLPVLGTDSKLTWSTVLSLYYEYNRVGMGGSYSPIEGPKYQLRPGDNKEIMVTFSPKSAGNFMDSLLVTINPDVTFKIYFKGSAFNPPVIRLDQTPISELFSKITDTAIHGITVKNDPLSQVNLNYQVSVEYIQDASSDEESDNANATATTVLSDMSTLTLQKGNRVLYANNQPEAKSAKDDSNYNRVLDYEPENPSVTVFGVQSTEYRFIAGTRFNSGDESFNLSNVGFYLRKEGVQSGTIEIEVRAINAEYIHEGTLLATGMYNFTNDKAYDSTGGWVDVELNNKVGIYPNENFFVIITFPAELQFPLGTYTNGETIPSTFVYRQDGTSNWADIQSFEGYENIAWMFYAAEKEPIDLSWIEILSPAEGTLSAGDSAKTEIKIKSNAIRGTQQANIVYTSNASATPALKIPVTVRLNDGPEFYRYVDLDDEWVLTKETLNYYMRENATYTFDILVRDVEGDTYELEAVQTDPILSYNLIRNPSGIFDTLRITFSTAFGDQGTHEYVFNAMDEREVESVLTLVLEVAKTNRAPIFTYGDTIVGIVIGDIAPFTVYHFFTDPDGDKLVLNIDFEDLDFAEILLGKENFEIRSKAEGLTMLTMTAIDPLGLRTSQKVALKTGTRTSNKDIAKESNTIILTPNPVKDIVKINSDSESWNGRLKVEILDVLGKIFLSTDYQTTNGISLDLDLSALPAGSYVMIISNNTGRESIPFIKE